MSISNTFLVSIDVYIFIVTVIIIEYIIIILKKKKKMKQAQKKNWDGPTIGVKVADENPREFSADQLAESHKIIGLQYGSNKGATQSGMTPYGATRQILPDGIFIIDFLSLPNPVPSTHFCVK